MQIPKILLLENGDPTVKTAGLIFLGELCSSYPNNKISPYFFPNGFIGLFIRHLPKKWKGLKVKYSIHPIEQIPFIKSNFPFYNSLNNIFNWIILTFYISILTKKVIQYAENEKSELIWVILNSASMIHLVKRIMNVTDLPIVCTIWDPPERFVDDLNMNPRRREMLLTDFQYILTNAKRVGVASEGMQIEYKNRYGITSIQQIHGVNSSLWQIPSIKLQNEKKFIIGFAGNLYAYEEFYALVSALDSVDWNIEKHSISMMIIGIEKPENSFREKSIQYFGWQSLDSTISLLSKSDIAYVPYWFNEKYSLSTRLCFPNKISTYLAAGKPILYHGPSNSSPTLFMKRYPIGLCCHSLEKEQIIDCLRRFIVDPKFYESSVSYVQKALQEELNQKTFFNRFAELVGLDASNLINQSVLTTTSESEVKTSDEDSTTFQ